MKMYYIIYPLPGEIYTSRRKYIYFQYFSPFYATERVLMLTNVMVKDPYVGSLKQFTQPQPKSNKDFFSSKTNSHYKCQKSDVFVCFYAFISFLFVLAPWLAILVIYCKGCTIMSLNREETN